MIRCWCRLKYNNASLEFTASFSKVHEELTILVPYWQEIAVYIYVNNIYFLVNLTRRYTITLIFM